MAFEGNGCQKEPFFRHDNQPALHQLYNYHLIFSGPGFMSQTKSVKGVPGQVLARLLSWGRQNPVG